jgi:hypothetical protein
VKSERRQKAMTLVSEESPRGEYVCSPPDATWDVDVDELEWDVDIELDLEGLRADAEEFGHA